MAILYNVDGSAQAVTPKGKQFEIRELQTLIGGFVEVRRHDQFYFIFREEGEGLVRNPISDLIGFTLVGPVLFTRVREIA